MDPESLYLEADAEYEKGDLESAFNLFLASAKEGCFAAMTRVANMYTCGEGVACDYDKAIEWEKKATESGDTSTFINIAISYRIKGDMKLAKQWLEAALAAGDGEAALELAKLYMICDLERCKVVEYLRKVIESQNVCDASREETARLLTEYDISEQGRNM